MSLKKIAKGIYCHYFKGIEETFMQTIWLLFCLCPLGRALRIYLLFLWGEGEGVCVFNTNFKKMNELTIILDFFLSQFSKHFLVLQKSRKVTDVTSMVN